MTPSTLSDARLRQILAPYLADASLPPDLFSRLSTYLDLLLRWNARTNLTAIREPEQIVRRHFGESLFAGLRLRSHLSSGAAVLDFGSGAGFPGLPIQLLLPDLHVTLAESQGKKASFLREAVRTLGLGTEVWAHRVEAMPTDRLFDAVTLRAVDRMPQAVNSANARLRPGGWLLTLTSGPLPATEAIRLPESRSSWLTLQPFPLATPPRG